MAVKLLPRKRWRVAKYSKKTWRQVRSEAPEANRLFWTERSAIRERNRLSRIAYRSGLPYDYQVHRTYGK